VTSTGGGSTGVASYYWQPQRVASGGWFNPNALTAAHKTLPFGTRVQVTNLSNGRSVTVTINDRGPYIKGRVIDLSRAAASAIGMTGAGIARVSYSVVGRG
jgi:rare lipoprotein A